MSPSADLARQGGKGANLVRLRDAGLPVPAFAEGHTVAVPMIIGTNDREGSLFLRLASFSRFAEALPPNPHQTDATLAAMDPEHHRRLVTSYEGYPKHRSVADLGVLLEDGPGPLAAADGGAGATGPAGK